MATALRTCPHCHAENQFFKSNACWPHGGHPLRSRIVRIYEVIFRCDHCDGAIGMRCEYEGRGTPHDTADNIPESKIIDEYPRPESIDAPSHVPENIVSVFKEARDNQRRENWDSAGMAGRRTLDLATKALRPEDDAFKAKSLFDRIDDLAAAHEITPAMQDWAHAVRDSGNEANHEETPFTKSAVEQLLAFAETFLMYAFTLPAMVATWRDKRTDQ